MRCFVQVKEVVEQLRKSPFILNVGKLVGGSAFAQIITLACAPILTRLYTPADFGLLGVFMAIATVGCTIATLRYDLAVMLPKDDASSWHLLRLAAKWSLLGSVVVFSLLIPVRERLAFALGAPELASYFIWLPLLVISGGWLSLASHWAVRKKRFGVLSRTAVSSCLVGNSLKIGGGMLGFGGGFLIFSSFVQQAAQLVMLVFRMREEVPDVKSDTSESLRLAREYRDFPLYRMPQDTLAAFAANLPNILLAAFFSPAVVGFYLLAHRVTLAPISLVREAVRNVFYQKATELYHEGRDLYKSVLQMTLGLAVLTLPIVVILFLYGESLFGLVFGAEWSIAGVYAKYISILVFASVINTPSVVVVPILGKNRGLLFYEVFGTGLRSATLVIAGMYLDAVATVALFSLASAFANLFLVLWVLGLLRKDKINEQTTS